MKICAFQLMGFKDFPLFMKAKNRQTDADTLLLEAHPLVMHPHLGNCPHERFRRHYRLTNGVVDVVHERKDKRIHTRYDGALTSLAALPPKKSSYALTIH